MIIISQDKKELINFDNVINITITDCEEEGYLISVGFIVGRDDNYRDLGYYKTQERAEEILRQIKIAYSNIKMINIPKIQINELLSSVDLMKYISYEMPKE